jgi:hypothetical protein
MSTDRTASTWDQIQNKLSAHWGKLTVEDLCLAYGGGETGARTPLADSQPEALMPGRLTLAPTGS